MARKNQMPSVAINSLTSLQENSKNTSVLWGCRNLILKTVHALALVSCFICTTQQTAAQDVTLRHSLQPSLADALLKGKWGFETRYRYEFLDDEAFSLNARASTIRALLSYETQPLYGVSLFGELRVVERIGTENSFNDTLNGNTTRPVIPDPQATEVDQAFIKFDNVVPDTVLTFGRRKVALNNQRFISTLPFRQNANSFDGLIIENTSMSNIRLHYSYSSNFNRAFTDDSPVGNFDEGDIQLLHAEYTPNDRFKLVGYGYFLGIDENSFPGASNLATNSIGINAKGQFKLTEKSTFHYDVEYANQVDNSQNSGNFNLNYYRIQSGISRSGWSVNVGLEVLEGDGVRGFTTPLALLHAFNGFADIFTATPADGLNDIYVNLTFKPEGGIVKIGSFDLLKDTSIHVAYHEFTAENSGARYGSEIDISFKKQFTKNLTMNLEYAHYNADFNGVTTSASPRFTRDTDQVTLDLTFKY